MEDLIRRKDAIECCFHGDGRFRNIRYAVEDIRRLQSAQLDVPDTNVGDMISRQDAIDICINAIDLWNGQIGCGALIAVKDKIAGLPSAQQRIPRSERLHEKSCLRCVFSEPTPAGIRECKNLKSSLFGRESTEELWCSNFTEAASRESETEEKCEFCQTLKFQKILNSANCHFKTEYSAALIMQTRRKGDKEHYKLTEKNLGFELNFCPECGRDLREEEDDG